VKRSATYGYKTPQSLTPAGTTFEFTAWGKGYAGLSYSLRDKDMIINYIINQQEHHKTISFKEEYLLFNRIKTAV